MAEQKAIQNKELDNSIIPVQMFKLNSGHFLVVVSNEMSVKKLRGLNEQN